MENLRLVLVYRWSVLVLSLGYFVYTMAVAEWVQFSGPFRYLTYWAFFMAIFVAWHVLQLSRGNRADKADIWISAAAVINLMVVFLFWRLYFNDPLSVTEDGELSVWWREYYLHAVGPALLIFDAVFINRVFRQYFKSLAVLVGIVVLYVLWIEFVLAPINDDPVGTLHDGYPYPFLNDLAFKGRAIFYGFNLGVAALFLGILTGLAALIRRFA